MPDQITLDRNQSVALIDCLVKAAELSERTGNLELAATALYFADLIIDRDVQPEETLMCESSFPRLRTMCLRLSKPTPKGS